MAPYVDDMVVFINSVDMKNELVNELNEVFSVKDLGDISFCLGMQIERRKDNLVVKKSAYIDKVVKNLDWMAATQLRLHLIQMSMT